MSPRILRYCAQIHVTNGLVKLRHLATDADPSSSPEDGGEFLDGVNNTMTRLVQNHRVGTGGDGRQSRGEERRDGTVSSDRFLIA